MLGKPTFTSSAGLMGMLLLCQVTRQETSFSISFPLQGDHLHYTNWLARCLGFCSLYPHYIYSWSRGFTGLFTGGSEVRPQLVNSFNFSQGFKHHAGARVKENMGKRIPNFISKPIIETNKHGQLEEKQAWMIRTRPSAWDWMWTDGGSRDIYCTAGMGWATCPVLWEEHAFKNTLFLGTFLTKDHLVCTSTDLVM